MLQFPGLSLGLYLSPTFLHLGGFYICGPEFLQLSFLVKPIHTHITLLLAGV